MPVQRMERIDALLRHVLGDAVPRVLQSCDVESARITVTAVHTGKDLRNATVRVSVYGDAPLREKAVNILNKRARDFQAAIGKEAGLRCTPRLRFVADESLAKGDRVLSLLSKLESGERDPKADALDDIPRFAPPPRPVFEPVSTLHSGKDDGES